MIPRLTIIVATVSLSLSSSGVSAQDSYSTLSSDTVLITVNGQPITRADLDFELLWRRVPENQQQMVRRRFAAELIDRKLLRGFLEQRRVEVPGELLDRQLAQLRQLTDGADGDFDTIIQRLGFTEESLRMHIELPMAWRMHLNRVITDTQLQEFFAERREQLDGTRIRASQIVIAVPESADEAEWQVAEQTLQEARREIMEGDIEFAAAARIYSTSPSRENGGDLGLFTFHGKLPAGLASVAFELEPDAVSQPVRSRFGVHLLLTTERVAGQLSLEDVRPQVLEQLSQQLWEEQAKQLRSEAEIEWRVDAQILEPADPS